MGKAEEKPEAEQPEAESALGGAVAADVDGDGKLDLDPAKVEQTLADLVTLDHELRDHGLSVAALLKAFADKSFGVRV